MTTAAGDRDNWDGGGDQADQRRAPWRWLPIVVALIVFEVTLNPMLAVALACFRFGDADFATAWWLLRRDPLRQRSYACAGFHVAWGFARILTMAVVAMLLGSVLVVVVVAAFPAPMMFLFDQVMAALFTILVAGVACLVSSSIAIAVAAFGRLKIWVSPTTHEARVARRWPPLPEVTPPPEANRVMSALAISSILALPASFVGIGMLSGWAGVSDQTFVILLSLIGAIEMVGLIVLLIVLNFRIVARQPSECWQDQVPPSVGGQPTYHREAVTHDPGSMP